MSLPKDKREGRKKKGRRSPNVATSKLSRTEKILLFSFFLIFAESPLSALRNIRLNFCIQTKKFFSSSSSYLTPKAELEVGFFLELLAI